MWISKAADQGNAAAQDNLGIMYANGQGVTQDSVIAYALFNLSAKTDASGNNTAASNRDKLAAKMSASKIEAARALTREIDSKPVSISIAEYLEFTK
jgi:TPR repeat protein